jgi:hypothetical protein
MDNEENESEEHEKIVDVPVSEEPVVNCTNGT